MAFINRPMASVLFRLGRAEEDSNDPAHTVGYRVRVQRGKAHPAVESNEFAHSRHRGLGRYAVGTMKRFTSQGIAA